MSQKGYSGNQPPKRCSVFPSESGSRALASSSGQSEQINDWKIFASGFRSRPSAGEALHLALNQELEIELTMQCAWGRRMQSEIRAPTSTRSRGVTQTMLDLKL
jgi:hypothetical protein